MDWDKMTTREKAEHIVQDIMGWTYFPTWDLAHTARWTLEHGPITYPYAFWNDQQEGVSVFYRDLEDARPFNPFESMDAAWQVVQKLKDRAAEGYINPYNQFILEARNHFDRHIHMAGWAYNVFPKLTPEIICLAALKAVGIST